MFELAKQKPNKEELGKGWGGSARLVSGVFRNCDSTFRIALYISMFRPTLFYLLCDSKLQET